MPDFPHPAVGVFTQVHVHVCAVCTHVYMGGEGVGLCCIALYVERMCVVCVCIACMYRYIVCSRVVGVCLVMYWRFMVCVRYVCI